MNIFKINEQIKYYVNEIRRKTLFISIRDSSRAEMMALEINKQLRIYKDFCKGKNVYIVGGGLTEAYYNPSDKEGVYIGINRAFKNKKYKFDFLFAQDQFPEGMKEFFDYSGNNCKKMIGITGYDYDVEINESEIHGDNVLRYVLESKHMQRIPQNIIYKPFADLRGTVFSAIQFALYMYPSSIYLIGFDCSAGGDLFTNKKENYRYQLKGWTMIQRFISDYYKDIGIISINPVGLKGMFSDVYTEQYLEDKSMKAGRKNGSNE